MKTNLILFLCGTLFAVGLGISGMTQPERVIGFLDIFRDWNPSLLFVMVGAVLVHMTAYFFMKRRSSPLLSPTWYVPNRKDITPQLMIGSALFGMGWGLAGYCPGPALVSLASLATPPMVITGAMFVGWWIFVLIEPRFTRPS